MRTPRHLLHSTVHRRAQSGQAIVLIALMMVGLLGMAGLALDGGSLLFLQRKAQTVAEMAALSAATMACREGGATDAAIRQEAIRVAGLEGNDVSSDMLSPEPQITRTGDWTDITVTVKLPKPSYFIHLVYQGDLAAEGRSVARCSGDAAAVANPYADAVLFATSQDCSDTLLTEGGTMTYTGSLRSNGDVYLNASSGGSGSAASVTITGTVNYVGQARGNRTEIWAATPPRLEGYWSMDIAGRGVPVNSDPDDDSGAGLLRGPVQSAPLLYNIDDFRPGGAIWNSIPENRRYAIQGSTEGNQWHWTGICENPDVCRVIPTWGDKIQGLYFVEGDFIATGSGAIMNAMIGDGITIVATGKIKVTGPAFHMTPYFDNLQMMSGYGAQGGYASYEVGDSITTGGTCGSDGNTQTNAVYLPPGGGSNSLVFGTRARPGLIYAPWGRVYMGTGDVGPSHGQIIAYAISSHQSNSAIHHGPTASGVGSVTSPLNVYYTD